MAVVEVDLIGVRRSRLEAFGGVTFTCNAAASGAPDSGNAEPANFGGLSAGISSKRPKHEEKENSHRLVSMCRFCVQYFRPSTSNTCSTEV